MAEETLLKFSAELRAQRESKGISLAQISNRTKIDVKFLTAIEEGKFDTLPEIYMRAFIKEYSQVLELNPATTLSKYDIAKSGKTLAVQSELITEEKKVVESKPEIIEEVEVSSPTSQTTDKNGPDTTEIDLLTKEAFKTSSDTKLSKVKFNYVLGGIVLIVALAVFYFAFVHEPSDEIIANENKISNEDHEDEPRYEVNQPTISQDLDSTGSNSLTTQPSQIEQNSSVSKSDSLHLQVLVTSRVWVKIYSDGKVVFQQLVEGGTKLSYKAKNRFAVSVQDAGVIKIFFNNKPVPNIGKAGESRNITITPEGVKYYTISNERKSKPTN